MAEVTVAGFNNLEKETINEIKDVMAEKALAGDAAAATAFAHMLNAETNRQQLLVTAAGVEMGEAPVAAPSWADRVIDGGRPAAEVLTVAA